MRHKVGLAILAGLCTFGIVEGAGLLLGLWRLESPISTILVGVAAVGCGVGLLRQLRGLAPTT